MAKSENGGKESMRERAIATAIEHFSKLGFFGARIDNIARDSRVNKRIVYEYFKSKEGLYQAVIDEFYKMMEEPSSVIFVGENMDFKGRLEQFLRWYFNFLKGHADLMRMLTWDMMIESEEYERRLKPLVEKMLSTVTELFRQGKAVGALRENIDDKEINFLTICIHGAYYMYFTRKKFLEELWEIALTTTENEEKFLKTLFDMITKGILK